MRRFKRVLEDMKTELAYALENCVDRLVVSQGGDPVDQMRELTEQDLDSRNISLLMGRLRDVAGALRAIQDGDGGRCASCDGEIPRKRMEAVPWSLRCVTCEEAAEAPGAGRGGMEETARGGRARASQADQNQRGVN